MPFLVRKIEKAKWMQNDVISGEDISADAITNCMKTTGNTLSTWQAVGESDVSEAILAIVAGHQHLDAIDIVCLNRESLEKKGLILESTSGNTPVRDLVNRHIDISSLTYTTLGIVGREIVEEIKAKKVMRYTKGMLRKLLNDAILKGRFQRDDLNESLRNRL